MNKTTLLRLAAAALLFVVLSGCSLHTLRTEEYHLPLPEKYSSDVQTTAAKAATGRWWEHFNDEKLNALIEEALRNNHDIAQAYERFQQAQAALRSVSSAEGFQMNISATGGRTRQPGMFGPEISDRYSLSAAAGYELDVWKKLSSRSEAASLDARAAKQDLMALYMSISATVADLYYLSVEQREQLGLAGRIIDSFRDTLERVERRYREGVVPVIDVYQSRQNLASAETLRPGFEGNLTVTLHALSIILGRFPESEIGLALTGLPEAPLFRAGISSELVNRRPDVRAALLRLNASDERVGAAIADRLPSFNLMGTYGGSSDRLQSVLSSPNILWNLLFEIVQPVLDSGRRKAEADRSEAAFREKLSVYHKTILQAFREVEDALARNREAGERIELLEKRALAAGSEHRVALENYMQGISDYLPVLTAQQRYYETERLLLDAKRQRISARIALARSLGGDWMEKEMEKRTTAHGQEEDNN